jgi:hypothetical protein
MRIRSQIFTEMKICRLLSSRLWHCMNLQVVTSDENAATIFRAAWLLQNSLRQMTNYVESHAQHSNLNLYNCTSKTEWYATVMIIREILYNKGPQDEHNEIAQAAEPTVTP